LATVFSFFPITRNLNFDYLHFSLLPSLNKNFNYKLDFTSELQVLGKRLWRYFPSKALEINFEAYYLRQNGRIDSGNL
jgi:hypothetical protein